jgi:5-methylcytosine-specific restriction endonuclease McrA
MAKKWWRSKKFGTKPLRDLYVNNRPIRLTYLVSRGQVIEKLGGKCVRCGFSDRRALHIDHKVPCGSHNRESWLDLHKKILNGSDEFQILCANCNDIKKYEEKENHMSPERRLLLTKLTEVTEEKCQTQKQIQSQTIIPL